MGCLIAKKDSEPVDGDKDKKDEAVRNSLFTVKEASNPDLELSSQTRKSQPAHHPQGLILTRPRPDHA